MYNLTTWQLDRRRSGEIFKAKMKDKGFTVQQVADGTGISYDTLNNVLNCKSDPTVERVLKLCMFLGMDLHTDYLAPLFDGLDVEEGFADQIKQIVGTTSVKASPAPAACGNKAGCEKQIKGLMEVFVDSQEKTLDRFKAVHDRYHQEQVQQLRESRDLIIAAKDAQIATLRDDLAEQAKHITRLRNRNKILGIAVAAETVFIAVTWLMDFLIHDNGWVRRTIASFFGTGFDVVNKG